jgi:hypothetical protein
VSKQSNTPRTTAVVEYSTAFMIRLLPTYIPINGIRDWKFNNFSFNVRELTHVRFGVGLTRIFKWIDSTTKGWNICNDYVRGYLN